MFGFNWNDGSDWTWHDVACKIADDIDAENAKLREEVEQWHRLTAGIELPEYPITEFKPKDLNRENAKLRELVRALDWCTENCDTPRACDRCPLKQSDILEPECEVMMRDLGIEVS